MKSIRVLCLVLALMLVAIGADVNVNDDSGRTPLRRAKEKGHTEIVEFLCKHGAME